jgi:hypothetical protein
MRGGFQKWMRALLAMGFAGMTMGGLCGGQKLLGPITPGDGSVVTTFSFGLRSRSGGRRPSTLSVS